MYPVGTPIIEIHDPVYYPCVFHFKDPLFQETGGDRCKDTLARKIEALNDKKYNHKSIIKQVSPTDLHGYIQNFFGFLLVDIVLNSDRYHQTIQVHDGSRIMPTCRKTFKYPVFSEMLKYEISKGAVVTKIYRADRYKSKSSPWNGGPLSILYKCKMQHSKTINPEDYTRITERMATFGVDCSTIATWSKNKVRKQIAKGIITAAWGKHAESVDHPACEVIKNSSEKSWNFYDSLLHNKHNISNISVVGEFTKFDYTNSKSVRPKLDKGYLPWAVAVTSYGRMKLDGEMQKIDPPGQSPRMTMCDTDSVIYGFKENQYTTPEGDCLGDWETEGTLCLTLDFESGHQGLKSFVSCGPKSYIMTAGDGTVTKKLKGVSLSLGHSTYYTHDIVKSNVIHNSNPSNHFSNKRIKLPQRNFKSLNTNLTSDGHTKSGVGGAMTIYESLKEVAFHINDIKGEFREDGQAYRVYPFGYTGVL